MSIALLLVFVFVFSLAISLCPSYDDLPVLLERTPLNGGHCHGSCYYRLLALRMIVPNGNFGCIFFRTP